MAHPEQHRPPVVAVAFDPAAGRHRVAPRHPASAVECGRHGEHPGLPLARGEQAGQVTGVEGFRQRQQRVAAAALAKIGPERPLAPPVPMQVAGLGQRLVLSVPPPMVPQNPPSAPPIVAPTSRGAGATDAPCTRTSAAPPPALPRPRPAATMTGSCGSPLPVPVEDGGRRTAGRGRGRTLLLQRHGRHEDGLRWPGASSGTARPGARECSASASAQNTAFASITGGSPTALVVDRLLAVPPRRGSRAGRRGRPTRRGSCRRRMGARALARRRRVPRWSPAHALHEAALDLADVDGRFSDRPTS